MPDQKELKEYLIETFMRASLDESNLTDKVYARLQKKYKDVDTSDIPYEFRIEAARRALGE